MPVLTRYFNITKGSLVITGNTIGLDKGSFNNSPGNIGSIGSVIGPNDGLDSQQKFPSNWASQAALDKRTNIYTPTQNQPYPLNPIVGSKAQLYIPPTAKVLYADLLWFGTRFPDSKLDVNLNSSVTFKNITDNLSVDLSSSSAFNYLNVPMSSYQMYIKYYEVTKYITPGNKTYELIGIPYVLNAMDNNSNGAGWCLIAAYEEPTETFKNLSIYLLGEPITTNKVVSIDIPQVFTPDTPPINGRALISAAEGDLRVDQDFVKFGKDRNNQYTLRGNNNPQLNFFRSMINVGDYNPTIKTGEIDTRGSMGNNNHDNANTRLGTRQGLDIANVDISPALSPNQQTAVLTFGTSSDNYIPLSFGVQIEVMPSVTKSVDKATATIGDTLTYTAIVKNPGSVLPWKNVTLKDVLGPYLQFDSSYGVYINNLRQPNNTDPNYGFVVSPSLPANKPQTVVFKAKVLSLPPYPYKIDNVAELSYTIGDLTYKLNTLSAFTSIVEANLSIDKSNDKTVVSCSTIITTTIVITNSGNVIGTVPLNQLNDVLPIEVDYDTGSLYPSNIGVVYNTSTRTIENIAPLNIDPNSTLTIRYRSIVKCN